MSTIQSAELLALEKLAPQLISDVANMVALMKGLLNGALRAGGSVSCKAGSRKLYTTGGYMSKFVARPDGTSEVFVALNFTGSAELPQAFMVVAGPQAVTHPDGTPMVVDTIPDALAAVAAGAGTDATVTPTHGTYRVDTLALAPDVNSPGEWFLILGRPTEARSLAAAGAIDAPQVPAMAADALFPVARITTRVGSKGISQIEIIAPRLGGR